MVSIEIKDLRKLYNKLNDGYNGFDETNTNQFIEYLEELEEGFK